MGTSGILRRMSRENVEVIRRLYETFDRGDLEATLEALDPQIEWKEPPEQPEGAVTRHGREGVREGLSDWLRTWRSYRVEPQEFIEAGDQVLVRIRQLGQGQSRGVEVESDLFQAWTLRAGKPVRMEMYFERSAAMEAVGLAE
jgi:uncharacterized protein